jgi:indole-3-glycerol phosphate synthase
LENQVTEEQKAEVRELLKKDKPELIKKLKPDLSDAVDAVIAEAKQTSPAGSGCRLAPRESFRI